MSKEYLDSLRNSTYGQHLRSEDGKVPGWLPKLALPGWVIDARLGDPLWENVAKLDYFYPLKPKKITWWDLPHTYTGFEAADFLLVCQKLLGHDAFMTLVKDTETPISWSLVPVLRTDFRKDNGTLFLEAKAAIDKKNLLLFDAKRAVYMVVNGLTETKHFFPQADRASTTL